MHLPKVYLRKGRDKSVRNFHPWIFSGAIDKLPDAPDGSAVSVHDAGGSFLAVGYLNRKSSIQVRILAFEQAQPKEIIARRLRSAALLRQKVIGSDTTAYRLVNSEGDGLPGLTVDKYDDVLVVQIGTLGMEKLKDEIVAHLVALNSPSTVLERSSSSSRTEEGLESAEQILFGSPVTYRDIREYGHKFRVDFETGQKTGFFLDQREMRKLVGEMARDLRVLNCFCYTGGFSVYAAASGAASVTSVDVSEAALAGARYNLAQNGISAEASPCVAQDVFEYLRIEQPGFDFIILDPPAFAKKKSHIVEACRGYGEINRQAFSAINNGGYLLTCSCSYFVDEKLFQQVVFQAARDADRGVRILQHHRHAFDHPVSIFHPEGAYLKSLLLQVE